MDPNILLTETHPINTLSCKIYLSDLPLMETITDTQEKLTTPNIATTVYWYTLSHQQLTMDPTIAALTRKY